jgi:hypothetical protein
MGKSEKKNVKPPLPKVVEHVFLRLAESSVDQVKQNLSRLSHAQLLDHAARITVHHDLMNIYHLAPRKRGAKVGGRQSDWRVHLARYWAQIAVVSLHFQNVKVTEKLILKATDDFQDEISRSGVKTDDLGKKRNQYLDVSYAAKQELRAYNLWKKGESNYYDCLKDFC